MIYHVPWKLTASFIISCKGFESWFSPLSVNVHIAPPVISIDFQMAGWPSWLANVQAGYPCSWHHSHWNPLRLGTTNSFFDRLVFLPQVAVRSINLVHIRYTSVGQYSWSEVVLRDPHEHVAFNTVELKAKFQKTLFCVSSSHILQALPWSGFFRSSAKVCLAQICSNGFHFFFLPDDWTTVKSINQVYEHVDPFWIINTFSY